MNRLGNVSVSCIARPDFLPSSTDAPSVTSLSDHMVFHEFLDLMLEADLKVLVKYPLMLCYLVKKVLGTLS